MARRDMTEADFKSALTRAGFRQVLWRAYDTTGVTQDSFPLVFSTEGVLQRRASVTALIRARAALTASSMGRAA